MATLRDAVADIRSIEQSKNALTEPLQSAFVSGHCPDPFVNPQSIKTSICEDQDGHDHERADLAHARTLACDCTQVVSSPGQSVPRRDWQRGSLCCREHRFVRRHYQTNANTGINQATLGSQIRIHVHRDLRCDWSIRPVRRLDAACLLGLCPGRCLVLPDCSHGATDTPTA